MKIAFDIDGVIAKSDVAIRDEILARTGYDVSPTWNTFNFQVPNYNWDTVYDIIQEAIINRNDQIEPYEGAIESLHKLVEFQYSKQPITFVTARPSYLKEITQSWMSKHLDKIPHAIVYTEDKNKYLTHNKFQVIVEDRLKTANELSTNLSAIYLVNRPWNLGREHAWNVIRVNSVNDAIDMYIGGMRYRQLHKFE